MNGSFVLRGRRVLRKDTYCSTCGANVDLRGHDDDCPRLSTEAVSSAYWLGRREAAEQIAVACEAKANSLAPDLDDQDREIDKPQAQALRWAVRIAREKAESDH